MNNTCGTTMHRGMMDRNFTVHASLLYIITVVYESLIVLLKNTSFASKFYKPGLLCYARLGII
jgi:hypothetical protein